MDDSALSAAYLHVMVLEPGSKNEGAGPSAMKEGKIVLCCHKSLYCWYTCSLLSSHLLV